MGTFWHALQKGKRTKIPSRLLFYDCETYPQPYETALEEHRLKVGIACYVSRQKTRLNWREEWLKFTSHDNFWNFVEKKAKQNTRLWLIAHNQQFDFMVVNGFKELITRGWELNFHVILSGVFIARFNKKKANIIVIDSLNWLKGSIKRLGKMIGSEKGEIDFDNCSFAELTAYCKQDVQIVKSSILLLIKFIRTNNMGSFQLTRSSQAFAAYKHRFMDYKVFIHAHAGAIALERASYRGGWNECFFIGKVRGKIFDLDVNSLYPFVMQKFAYPSKLHRVVKHSTPDKLRALISDFCVIAYVKIHIDEPFIAIKRERLLFPIGTFWITLTTPEIEAVFNHGKILEVGKVAIYRRAPIFKKFVTQVYAMRLKFMEEGNAVFKEYAKDMMNHLYGKFGQRIRDFKEITTAPIDMIKVERIIDYDTREIYTEYTFGGKVYRMAGEIQEWRDSFPAIASHVTAYARLYLWFLLQRAKRENVYYCDTDSLFLNEEGFNNLEDLVDARKLGALKVEKVANYLEIRGCKDYKIDDIEKIKGIKKDAIQIADNIYQQTKFYKFRSLVRKGKLDAPLTEIITKTLSRKYLKGIIQSDGRIKPFSLPSLCFEE